MLSGTFIDLFISFVHSLIQIIINYVLHRENVEILLKMYVFLWIILFLILVAGKWLSIAFLSLTLEAVFWNIFLSLA